MIIQPPSILVQGEVGAGKTWLISTLARAGLNCFVLTTEPTGVESLLDAWEHEKLPLNLLHYHQICPARIGFEGLQKAAENVSKFNFEQLSKLPPQGQRETSQWLTVLKTFTDFVDDRTGEAFGSIDDFDDTRAVIVDSLSGLNVMAMDLVVGDKTSAHIGEWGVAMGLIEKLILNLTSNMKCTLVVNAHLEREADELTGATKLMASTLGKKLAPRLPRFFSEVLVLKRNDKGRVIDTVDPLVITKTRCLPQRNDLPPTLEPIIAAYHKRKEFAASDDAASLQAKEIANGSSVASPSS